MEVFLRIEFFENGFDGEVKFYDMNLNIVVGREDYTNISKKIYIPLNNEQIKRSKTTLKKVLNTLSKLSTAFKRNLKLNEHYDNELDISNEVWETHEDFLKEYIKKDKNKKLETYRINDPKVWGKKIEKILKLC